MAYLNPLSKQWLLDRRVVADDGCWLWTMSCDSDGYGRLAPNLTGERAAHRLAWALFNGPIPDGLTIDHLCFTRACVNPGHLRLLSRLENCRRQRPTRTRKGTTASSLPTACGKGHVDDFYVAPNGARNCRECNREAKRRYRERKRAAA